MDLSSQIAQQPDPATEGERRAAAAKLPEIYFYGGYYPVDVEATVQTGWVTYGDFVATEKGVSGERFLHSRRSSRE